MFHILHRHISTTPVTSTISISKSQNHKGIHQETVGSDKDKKNLISEVMWLYE